MEYLDYLLAKDGGFDGDLQQGHVTRTRKPVKFQKPPHKKMITCKASSAVSILLISNATSVSFVEVTSEDID